MLLTRCGKTVLCLKPGPSRRRFGQRIVGQGTTSPCIWIILGLRGSRSARQWGAARPRYDADLVNGISETFKYRGAGQDASLRRPSGRGRGATMDVLVWLRSLGLERYEAAFRDNEIDERVLPSLTQEDLKEIGVGPVGHRRKLLDAITALRTDATANPSGDAVSSPPS